NEERLSLKTMFSNADESLKNKKKEKKTFDASKKESNEKMNFLDEHDFGDNSLDNEDKEASPDFRVKQQEKQQKINKKKKDKNLEKIVKDIDNKKEKLDDKKYVFVHEILGPALDHEESIIAPIYTQS
ncbi:hypothetical protein, partial [Campylobacter jejuni]|uniref:hypothetical protein n=1 Tax=Campylobacter jejuni TaxID=197 RepID=UPI002043EFDD